VARGQGLAAPLGCANSPRLRISGKMKQPAVARKSAQAFSRGLMRLIV
jgi:hypothetical protein